MHRHRHLLQGQLPRSVKGVEAGTQADSDALSGLALAEVLPDVLFYVDAPALDAEQLPDGATLAYALIESPYAHLQETTNETPMGVQTGAGGRGAAAALLCARPKLQGGQYFALRVKAGDGANVRYETFTLRVALI